MYLASNIRPMIDKDIESLAQAIIKNARSTGVYSTENVLGYAIAKLLTRIAKVKELSIPASLGTLEAVKQEFARKVAGAVYEKERNLYGDVFSELL